MITKLCDAEDMFGLILGYPMLQQTLECFGDPSRLTFGNSKSLTFFGLYLY